MKSNFYDQGMNVIAHHYFSGKKDVRQIRHNVQFSSVSLSRWENAKTWADQEKEQDRGNGQRGDFKPGDISGYRGRPTNANDQKATSQSSYVISSLSELGPAMKNGQSGQMLDLRDHRISPEVYAALARGEKVEVQMQQMAPERVNLFTPLLASAMQIFGGMAGGVAYNEDLSQVITGKGGTDKGQLGKAAEFVNKHGTAYDLGFGTGEHIDVVAKFRVLNQEDKRKPNDPPPVKIPTPKPDPKKPEGPEVPELSDQQRFLRGKPLKAPVPKVDTTKLNYGTLNRDVRVSPVDNGSPLVAIKPRIIDYKHIDKEGNGKTEDQNAHSFLENSYKGQYGSSGKVNNLTGNSALADSSSTIRGVSPKSTLKDGSGADWYKNSLKSGTYPVKAAQDYLSIAVAADLIKPEDLKGNKNPKDIKDISDPKVLGEMFSKAEDTLGDKYHLRESGNLGSAHIRALENGVIDKSQALNGAISFTTIATSQGQSGAKKLESYESIMSGDTKLNNLSVPAEIDRIEKIINPAQRQEARGKLTESIGNWLEANNFSKQESNALKDLSPKDVTNIKNELAKNGISLAKVASGDMTGINDGITQIENKLHSISDAIKSSGYDDSRLPQFQQLRSQIDVITGGKDKDGKDSSTGSVDTLKSLIQAKTSGEDAKLSIGSLATGLSDINKQGQLLPESEISQAKISLDKGGQELQSQIKALGLNTELKDIKSELAKPDSKLSIESAKSPELKANLENFVKADELLTQQTDLSGGLKALQGLQEKFKKGESISNEELSALKNYGNPTLDSGISKLKKAKDIKDINDLSTKLTSSENLTEADKSKLEELKVKYSSGDNKDTKLVDVIDSVIDGEKGTLQDTVQATGKIADEYNIMTGTREYLVPFAKDLESKGINIDSLKTNGKLNPDKALNFARALQSVGNPPKPENIESLTDENTKKLITDVSKLSNQSDISSLVEKSADIANKFRSQAEGGLDLHRTQDQEAVEVIKGYGLANGTAGVDLKTKDITTTASSVKITPAVLKNPNVMNMMQDYFKLSVEAKNLTQKEVNTAGSDPVKVDSLFKKLEHTLHEKYGLKEDQLFGAEHITDVQESLYDEARMVNKGVIAVDKLYEGKEMSTTQTSQLNSLLGEYKASGKAPAIGSIKDLKDNKVLAVSLLDFSKEKLTSIKTKIEDTKFEKYGQLAELSRDIDRVIGSESNKSVGLIALRNSIKESEVDSTTNSSVSKDYKESLKGTLNSLKSTAASGQTEVKIDQKDGKGEQPVKIIAYVKQLEKEYQSFLLDSDNDERVEVTAMADLFTKVHLDAGLASGDSKDNIFSELQGALGLSLEASNIDVDNLLLGKAGKPTADSKTITNQMISKVSQPELASKLKNSVDEKGDVDKAKLLDALSAKFSEFTDSHVKEFLAVAERLLKKAKPDANPAIDLTGIYEDAKKKGKGIEEAFKTSVGEGKDALNGISKATK